MFASKLYFEAIFTGVAEEILAWIGAGHDRAVGRAGLTHSLSSDTESFVRLCLRTEGTEGVTGRSSSARRDCATSAALLRLLQELRGKYSLKI